jgi:hypothetical protein
MGQGPRKSCAPSPLPDPLRGIRVIECRDVLKASWKSLMYSFVGSNKAGRLGGRHMGRTNQSTVLSALSCPYFVPTCFGVYFLLRAGLISLVPIDQHSDSLWYHDRAVALASGQGYSQDGVFTAFWPVGWPGFLGLLYWVFGRSAFVGQITNLMLAAVTFLLALRLGSAIFADRIVGRLTVLILTFPEPDRLFSEPDKRSLLHGASITRRFCYRPGSEAYEVNSLWHFVRRRNVDQSADPPRSGCTFCGVVAPRKAAGALHFPCPQSGGRLSGHGGGHSPVDRSKLYCVWTICSDIHEWRGDAFDW